jgi:hypothetical protein
MPHNRPPEPWHSFFLEIDKALDRPVELHCIGGFALAMLHGLARPTIDVDCLAVVPIGETARLQSLAGEGSALHRKYGVYVQHVGIVTAPENYHVPCHIPQTDPHGARGPRPRDVEVGTELGS